jgi:hypothetical protein
MGKQENVHPDWKGMAAGDRVVGHAEREGLRRERKQRCPCRAGLVK